jgi:hypothetical protein
MSFAANMKTIVVATDLNDQSEATLEYARKLAREYGSRICFLIRSLYAALLAVA